MKNGDVLWHPMLDSHSDLLVYHKLRDDNQFFRNFAKVELTPSNDNWLDPETWSWKIDEPTRPEWMDDAEEVARKKLVHIAKGMILDNGEHPLIIDGCWIIGGEARIGVMRFGRAVSVCDSAKIDRVYGSAKIDNVSGSAKIDRVCDSAKIDRVYGSAKIDTVRDLAKIGTY